jgi:hypothetical protein
VTTSLVPDFRAFFELGFNAIEAAENEWHKAEYNAEGIPYVHASQVGGCPRAYILAAEGHATDGNTLESSLNFAFGHTMHTALEHTFKYYPEFEGWKALCVEQGFTHSLLALKGKPDAVLQAPTGQPIVFDLKTESGGSKKMRVKAATHDGVTHTARPEHVLQVAAGALLAEDAGVLTETVTTGLILYLSRPIGVANVWDLDPVLFDITAEDRDRVRLGVGQKVRAWRHYQQTGELPPQLPHQMWYGKLTDPWQCRPREVIDTVVTDERGKYCAARSFCFGCGK